MNLIQSILNTQNGDSVRQLAQNFGLGEDQSVSALSSLIPALSQGLKQNVSSSDGLQDLLSALGSGNHQRYVDDVAVLGQPETIQEGNGILGHLLGSKDVKFYDVIGDTVNTAKRIENAASETEVLISEEARVAIGDHTGIGPSRNIAAKGKEIPVTVYPLLPPK